MAEHCAARLALPVDGLGQPLAQDAVVVDPGESQIGEGQPAEPVHGLVGGALSRPDVVQEALQSRVRP